MGKREAPFLSPAAVAGTPAAPRTLLLVAVVAAALYAGVHCLFRPRTRRRQMQREEETLSDTKLEDTVRRPAITGAQAPVLPSPLLSGEDDGNGGSDTNILIGF